MYNWEIDEFLRENNYRINYDDYIKIQTSSPQIDHVKFDPYNDHFTMWTIDGYIYEFQCIKVSNKN